MSSRSCSIARHHSVLDVLLQQHAVVAVVVGRAEAAVDLRGGEDEAAPLAERDDLVHRDFGRSRFHRGPAMPWRNRDRAAIIPLAVPIYEYNCDNGHVFDVIQSMSDEALTECQECGAPAYVFCTPRHPLQGLGLPQHRLRQEEEGRRQRRREQQGFRRRVEGLRQRLEVSKRSQATPRPRPRNRLLTVAVPVGLRSSLPSSRLTARRRSDSGPRAARRARACNPSLAPGRGRRLSSRRRSPPPRSAAASSRSPCR